MADGTRHSDRIKVEEATDLRALLIRRDEELEEERYQIVDANEMWSADRVASRRNQSRFGKCTAM